MENTEEITFFVSLTVLAMLFLITFIAFIVLLSRRKLLEKEKALVESENRRQLELIRAMVEVEETQKTKIANDLHDQIIPTLALKALNINTRLSMLENGKGTFEEIRKEVEGIAQLADHIREIAHGIIPKMFTSFGMVKSIEVAVKQLHAANGAKAAFKNNTIFSGQLPFSGNKQLTIYRICLEVLNNLRKHARYTYLTVTLEDVSSYLTIVFAHDGKGITNEEIAELTITGGGIGLKSMQSRILSLGAQINYTLDKGVSFVTLTIPIKHENSH